MVYPLSLALAADVREQDLRTAADRFGFNLRTGVGGLLASGKIDYAAAAAAGRWTEDYALAEFGARDPASRKGSSGQSPSGIADAKLFAATSRRKAKQKTGEKLDRLLISALVDGLTAKQIADIAGLEQRHVGGMLAATLAVLAEHYTNEDCPTRRK